MPSSAGVALDIVDRGEVVEAAATKPPINMT